MERVQRGDMPPLAELMSDPSLRELYVTFPHQRICTKARVLYLQG